MQPSKKLVKNAEKVDLITQLYESRGDRVLHLVCELLTVMVQETREFNDTAAPDEVLRNQGRITALKDLQEFIGKGVYRENLDIVRELNALPR